MTPDLGEIKAVPVRDLWKHEGLEFTPWLAKEENIGKLSDAMGVELQVEGVEVPVGPFSADILAKDAAGNYVVIENQFGKTDHDHLGKVLTYAATLDAALVVWIAERFTEEHRKAIEWLNDHTTESLGLFALEIQAWRIDQSKPALRLNVVSKPTEVVRQASAVKAAGQITDAQRLQLEFWTRFREKLLERKVVTSAQTPRPQYWFDIPLGRSNIVISNFANTFDGRIGVRVYLGNKVADLALPQLEADRAAIEKEIGEAIQWNPYPEKRDKVILLARDADLSRKDHWDEYLNWLVTRADKFRKVFGPRVKAITLLPDNGQHKAHE